jgi:hypothetical protein
MASVKVKDWIKQSEYWEVCFRGYSSPSEKTVLVGLRTLASKVRKIDQLAGLENISFLLSASTEFFSIPMTADIFVFHFAGYRGIQSRRSIL